MPGNLDPKKMQQMLKQLGMKMDEIAASQVLIKTDSGDITIDNPKVIKTTMKGQIVYQVSGNPTESTFGEEDVELVMEQTGVKDKEKVEAALKEANGEVVEAIMNLKS